MPNDPFKLEDLVQLTVCDVCRADVADRCHVRLQLAVCPRCAQALFAAEAVNGARGEAA